MLNAGQLVTHFVNRHAVAKGSHELMPADTLKQQALGVRIEILPAHVQLAQAYLFRSGVGPFTASVAVSR